MESTDDGELECRVCRSGQDLPNRPLYSPCLCTGSIGLVHQDCLENWLQHSQKEKCELCGRKYQFSPEYAKDTPKVLSLNIMIKTMLKRLIFIHIPLCFRVVAAFVVWFGVVPFCTSQLYRVWMHLDSFSANKLFSRMSKDAVSGFVLTAFIILTFIIMV